MFGEKADPLNAARIQVSSSVALYIPVSPDERKAERRHTKTEMAELLTHVAFYAGWPNAWTAFQAAVEVYKDNPGVDGGMFGLGQPNDAFAQYFISNSYLNPLTDSKETIFLANVTFEPGCRNNWHIHHASKGGGQNLLCTDGRGWYQKWGKEVWELHSGDVVYIPAGVKH